MLAVAHEQRRLQPDITAAMNVGLLTAAGIIHQVTPRWMPEPLEWLVAKLVGKPLARVATRLWQQTTTELLMTLRVPGAVLRLHHDVPPLPDGQRFPDRPGRAARHAGGGRLGGRRVQGVGSHRRLGRAIRRR